MIAGCVVRKNTGLEVFSMQEKLPGYVSKRGQVPWLRNLLLKFRVSRTLSPRGITRVSATLSPRKNTWKNPMISPAPSMVPATTYGIWSLKSPLPNPLFQKQNHWQNSTWHKPFNLLPMWESACLPGSTKCQEWALRFYPLRMSKPHQNSTFAGDNTCRILTLHTCGQKKT